MARAYLDRMTNPTVFPLALGCMSMAGGLYGPSDEAENIATIHAAHDRGVTLLDTGDIYGQGRNELLVGRALAGRRRDQADLSDKIGGLRAGNFMGFDSRPLAVKNARSYSLVRLGVVFIVSFRPARRDPSVPFFV